MIILVSGHEEITFCFALAEFGKRNNHSPHRLEYRGANLLQQFSTSRSGRKLSCAGACVDLVIFTTRSLLQMAEQRPRVLTLAA